MANATFCTFGSIALSLSPFPRSLAPPRRSSAISGSPFMIGLVRAVTICATLALGLCAAHAADKAFKRDDLANSAIKLEAQIKSEAGPVAKTGATLRTDADAAFKRNDYRTGLSCSARSPPSRLRTPATGCGSQKSSSRSRRRARASRPSCWSAPRPLPTSPISAPAIRARRRTRSPCSASRSPNENCGGRRWTRCGYRSICARSPTFAAVTRSCATSTVFGCSTIP